MMLTVTLRVKRPTAPTISCRVYVNEQIDKRRWRRTGERYTLARLKFQVEEILHDTRRAPDPRQEEWRARHDSKL